MNIGRRRAGRASPCLRATGRSSARWRRAGRGEHRLDHANQALVRPERLGHQGFALLVQLWNREGCAPRRSLEGHREPSLREIEPGQSIARSDLELHVGGSRDAFPFPSEGERNLALAARHSRQRERLQLEERRDTGQVLQAFAGPESRTARELPCACDVGEQRDTVRVRLCELVRLGQPAANLVRGPDEVDFGRCSG